jgi:hypothetical protein
MIKMLKELHYDVKADIEVCKQSILEYTRHAETAKAEMIAFEGTPEQLEKARISALLNRARSGAQEIRLVLPRNHPCPYCGGSLGSSRTLITSTLLPKVVSLQNKIWYTFVRNVMSRNRIRL